MADNGVPEDLSVLIGGDLTPLEDSLNQIGPIAAAASGEIEGSLADSLGPLDAGIKGLGDSLAGVGDAASATVPAIQEFESSFAALGPELAEIGAGVQEFFAGVDEAFATLQEHFLEVFAAYETLSEALTAFGGNQQFVTSMTALTGSASQAAEMFDKLEEIAQQLPVSFSSLENAAQKMTAFGISIEQIPTILEAAADAAAATGNSFDQVANALSRVDVTGQVSARQLVQLGLSWQDLATAAGVSIDEIQALLAKGGQDAATDLQVVTDALQKYQGVGAAVEEGITGQFQQLENSTHAFMATLGATLAPFAEAAITALNMLLQALTPLLNAVIAVEQMVAFMVQTFADAGPTVSALAEVIGDVGVAASALLIVLDATGWGIFIGIIGALAMLLSGVSDHMASTAEATAAAKAEQEAYNAEVDSANAYLDTFGVSLTAVGKGFTDLKATEIDAATEVADVRTAFMHAGDNMEAFLQVVANVAAQTPKAAAGLMAMAGQASVLAALGPAGAAALQALAGQAAQLAASTVAATSATDALAASHAKLVANLNSTKAALQAANAAYQEGIIGLGELNAAQKAYQNAWDAINGKIQTGTDNTKQLLAANESLIKVTDELGGSYDDYLSNLNSGGKDASQILQQIDSDLQKDQNTLLTLNGQSAATMQGIISDLQAAKITAQEFADQDFRSAGLDNLSTQIIDLQSKALTMSQAVPADFDDMMAAIAQGLNPAQLGTQLTKTIQQIQAQFNALPETLKESMGPVITATISDLQAIADKANTLNTIFTLVGKNTGMADAAKDATALATAMDQGWLTSQQYNTGLDSLYSVLTSKVVPALEKGAQITPQLVAALNAINPALASAAQGGVDTFVNKLTELTEAARATDLSVTAAMKDLGATSLDAAAQAMVKNGDDIIAVLKNVADASTLTAGQFAADQQAVIDWAQKALPEMQQFGISVNQDVLDQIAKIAPALAAAAKQGPDAFGQALDDLKTKAVTDIMSIAQAYTTFGAQSIPVLQDVLDKEQAAYTLLVQSNAPLQTQLAALEKIAQTQLQIAQYTDMTGQSELALTQYMTQIQAETFAVQQATMGLADLYKSLTADFVTAWNDFGKGIADAIVSGQNFGQAFTTVLDNLKKKLLEDIINGVMKQFGAAILENTGLLQAWNGLFNEMFGGGGSVFSGLNAAGNAFTDFGSTASSATKAASDALDNCTVSVQGFAQQTQTSMQQAATATQAAGLQMVSTLTAIGAVIGAIASIFSAIELAHTNTLLTRIEDSTRRTDITVEGAGVAAWTVISQHLPSIDTSTLSMIPYAANSQNLLQYISDHTKTIADTLTEIAAGGIVGGGDGSSGLAVNLSPLIVAINDDFADQAGLLDQIMEAIGQATLASSGLTAVVVPAGGVGNTGSGQQPGVGSSANALTTLSLPNPSVPAIGAGIGSTAAAVQSSGVTVSLTVQAGTVVGSNGMAELTTMIQKNLVNSLQGIASLKVR